MQVLHPKNINDLNSQLQKLVEQQVKNIRQQMKKSQYENDQFSSHEGNNVYFDKQLTHLVVSQQFNFQKISQILTDAFKDSKIDTSQLACRLRWTHLHKNRGNIFDIKEKVKQQKRAKSVAAFSNPYSLYSVDELIENLQKAQKIKAQKNEAISKPVQPSPTGYNILKDSFRKIDNFEQYNSLQAKMRQALKKAQEQVYEQKPLYFTPKYDNLQKFQVTGQQLTAEKAKKLLNYQIEMERISRQLQIKKQLDQQTKYESIIKKRVEKEKNSKQSNQSSQKGQIQQDWDQYQSD